MCIPDPDSFLGKKVRVYCTKSAGGYVITGTFYGFCYDFDDDIEFLEFDVEVYPDYLNSFTENEVERIEVLT